MSQVCRLRYRTIYAAGLAIALASLGIYLYPARLAGQVPSGTDPHPIRELQEERLATLRKIAELVNQKRRQGSASMAELASANRDVAEAERQRAGLLRPHNDMILAHTASPPPLPLPSGWVDAVEVNDDALIQLAELEAVAAAENKHVMLAEIHTVGDWMIHLKLETIILETVQEKLHLWNHLLELPAIPFCLKAGGIGAINSANIVRGTVCPPLDGIARTALAADLSQCIRS